MISSGQSGPDKVNPGLDNDDEEEGETDSKPGRDSGDCTRGTIPEEGACPCPSPNEATEDITLPPHPPQKECSSIGAEARTDKDERTPWENRCKGTQ